jgi:hypothetical protein
MTKKLATLAAFAALMTFPASAQPALQLQLSHCLAIPGVLQRLACYDGVARSTGVSVAAQPRVPALPAPAPTYSPSIPAPAPPTYRPSIPAPAPSFGGERLPQSEASRRAALDRIESPLAGFDINARGKFTVTLANGQVWKQLDGDDAVARPRKSARSVIIERAVFNSYALTFNDSSQRYKVARVQ